jgi:hypothetical protein
MSSKFLAGRDRTFIISVSCHVSIVFFGDWSYLY